MSDVQAPRPFHTLAEVAAILRAPVTTVRGLCREGDLTASFVAGKWIVRATDLDAFIDARANVSRGERTRRRRRRVT